MKIHDFVFSKGDLYAELNLSQHHCMWSAFYCHVGSVWSRGTPLPAMGRQTHTNYLSDSILWVVVPPLKS